DKTINVHISNIRKKISKQTDEDYIKTVWGIGFKMAE
ncbi:MAG: helix-turn-helix domain-containing protein, partial [Thomasclavelia spiroformis]